MPHQDPLRPFPQPEPLSEQFYARSPLVVAQALLGMYVVRRINKWTDNGAGDAVGLAGDSGLRVGRIVETEAYLGADDPAAHSAAGKTKRTAILFGKAGRAYVYQMRHHYLLNVVTEGVGQPTCVLLRALEPVYGFAAATQPVRLTKLMNGPAKLCRVLSIDLTHYGADLTSAASDLYIGAGEVKPFEIEATPRIGITKAVDKPYRFIVKGSPYLSR